MNEHEKMPSETRAQFLVRKSNLLNGIATFPEKISTISSVGNEVMAVNNIRNELETHTVPRKEFLAPIMQHKEPNTTLFDDWKNMEITAIYPEEVPGADTVLPSVSGITPGPYEVSSQVSEYVLQDLDVLELNQSVEYVFEIPKSVEQEAVVDSSITTVNDSDGNKILKCASVLTTNDKIGEIEECLDFEFHDSNDKDYVPESDTSSVRSDISESEDITVRTRYLKSNNIPEITRPGERVEIRNNEANVENVKDRESIPVSQHEHNETDGCKKSRKRIRQPEKWAKNVAKKCRNLGESYINVSGNVVPRKILKPPCTDKCRLKCSSRISEEERQTLHNNYWAIGSIDRQREYITRCMEVIQPKYAYKKLDSNRSLNYAYYFEINGAKIRVCKLFFLVTLDISSKMIFTTCKKKNDGVIEPDKRGCHGKRGRALDPALKAAIKTHIESFEAVDSHYCRASSTKQYLDGSLTLAAMYRMYVNSCIEKGQPYAKLSMYDHIFNTEYNIAFFKPKKDQCSQCECYRNSSTEEKITNQEKFDRHLLEKNLSRSEKENDLKYAQSKPSIQICCFDLQAVISLPCGDVSQFYYKRRLSCYNFTIYNITEKKGTCYLWHEGVAKRGANDIASCLKKYLEECEAEDIIFYADNCAGQNKNKFLVSLFMFHVLNSATTKTITLKFLVVGHTQNEGDSMHALIERSKKRTLNGGPIYIPSQLVPIIRLAKTKGHPYKTVEMSTDDFIDAKSLQESMGNNFKVNENGEVVSWNDLCVLRVEKSEPYVVFYKTSYTQKEYRKMNIQARVRRNRNNIPQLKKAYSQPPAISKAKKDDLISLCKSNSIPHQYWQFFETLKSE